MVETERNNLPVAEEPEFTTEIPAIRPDDPVHFAQMNSILESLLGNDVFLKRLADKMIENSLIAHALDCENSQMVLGADQGPAITGLIDEVKEDVTQLYSDLNQTITGFDVVSGVIVNDYRINKISKFIIGHMTIKLENTISGNTKVIFNLPWPCLGYSGVVTFLSYSTGKIHDGYPVNGELHISNNQNLEAGVYGVFFCYLTV